MRLLTPAISALLLVSLPAQDAPPRQDAADAAAVSREGAIDKLMSERESPEAFQKAIADARACGVNEQSILEARFLYHVDRREDAAVAAMLPEFLKRQQDFKIEDSSIFAIKDDWLAVIEYVQAIAALEKNDNAAFKRHITEAFWLSPRQSSAFAPHVERLRLQEAMRSVKIDFNTRFKPMASGDAIALDALIAGKKALLLHFWSPASPECAASMPDFAATAAALTEKGVAVLSLLPDDSVRRLDDARRMIKPLGAKAPGAWAIDSSEKSLGRELRVQDLPTMVLVSPEGKVLFNGDPADERFWNALGTIDAGITRPPSSLERTE